MNLDTLSRKMRRIRALALGIALLAASAVSTAAVFLSVNIAPPPLPVYAQPFAPGPDYMWTPGYWAWNGATYYWVPGTWVLAPYVGALWTPGYWGWGGAAYIWHPGYWGPRIGYYGGINYGFGYFGTGYYGGYWERGHFFYNTSVNRVDVTRIHNTYHRTVIENNVRTSYNGGAGGVVHTATAEERLAARDAHQRATPVQVRHERFASTNREQFASTNNGAPAMTATPQAYGRHAQTDGRVTRKANVNRGQGSPQGQHVDTFRAERTQAGQPQIHQERVERGPGGPQGRPGGGGGARPEGGGRHEGGGAHH